VVATTANQPPNTPNPTQNQESNHDQKAREADNEPETSRHGNRTVSTPSEHSDTENTDALSIQVPSPRREDEHAAPTTNQAPATLTAGPDGALWVTVDGTDVQQLAARISAVCDALITAQPPR
jgi:hypothetical protein